MTKIIILFNLILFCQVTTTQANESLDYTIYHQRAVDAEILIASENYKDALQVYEELFEKYEFIFLRDFQIATQLALFLNDEQKSKRLLINGIKSGWKIKSIRNNNFLDKIRKGKDWKSIKKQYHALNELYESTLNQRLRKRVKKMFSKDQRKAIRALFAFSSKAQDRYAEKKFAPHSEKQISEFLDILNNYGYPGEKFIGNDFWMSTILSHHNSISNAYNRKDTLYQNLKPKLKIALKKGEISAFEFALIDEWYRASKNDKEEPTYGILEGPLRKDLNRTNKLREIIFLRPIEVHNKLVDIQDKTGMNFYLDGHPWSAAKIEIRE
ncbi:hypothetical protein [Namhaeicola litoreus]|uniref:Uncharacterized protein n=1 Tax=Namhaeicola litoreus TaxID=1052145 RepID=A0ABW3Y468_9FLAO